MELAILDSAVKQLQKKKDVLIELVQGSMLYLWIKLLVLM